MSPMKIVSKVQELAIKQGRERRNGHQLSERRGRQEEDVKAQKVTVMEA